VARELAQRIKDRVRTEAGEYIRGSIGVSTNRFLAKLATNLQKPDGLVVLHPDRLVSDWGHLPIAELTGIGKQMDKRLRSKGIGTIADLCRIPPKQLRAIWKSVEGERFWYKLHGYQLEEFETQKRVVGHSHVLGSEWRPFDLSETVARRLLLKAASRLRRMDYVTTHMALYVKLERGDRLETAIRFAATSDSHSLCEMLDVLWQRISWSLLDKPRVKKLSVQLYDLIPASQYQPELFTWAQKQRAKEQQRRAAISQVMDRLNHRYGRDTIALGCKPNAVRQFSGVKIAFTRIPDAKEFRE
jgi:DNA polymerase-4